MKYHHRMVLICAALLAWCFCAVAPGLGEQREPSQPNILLAVQGESLRRRTPVCCVSSSLGPLTSSRLPIVYSCFC